MEKKIVSPRLDPRAIEFFESRFPTVNRGITFWAESAPAVYRRTILEVSDRLPPGSMDWITRAIREHPEGSEGKHPHCAGTYLYEGLRAIGAPMDLCETIARETTATRAILEIFGRSANETANKKSQSHRIGADS